MNQHAKLIELLRKYKYQISADSNTPLLITHEIPDQMLDKAAKHYANNVDKKAVVGLCDISVFGDGKNGFVFTDTKVYYREYFDKPKKLWYDEIRSVQISTVKEKDCDSVIRFYLKNGEEAEWYCQVFNKMPLLRFFNDLLYLVNNDTQFESSPMPSFTNKKGYGAQAGGYAFGKFSTANKLYSEEKFHASQGHGFAAERANDLHDKLHGHKTKVEGDKFVKNGPDRVVDGVFIQSKYCKTGNACINDCFDSNGNFRYMVDGKPMQIEVPSDKYDTAVKAMEEKIRQGKMPGITDPKEAENIVRKGNVTYEQAKNIAKAGTVDSLVYDSKSGAVIATSAFGVTAMVTFATNLWNGESFADSLKIATYSGIKVGGTAFLNTVIASQLSKAGLNSMLVGSSEAVVNVMGAKASAVLINAFRVGEKSIYGAAAMKSAAKLLRGNVITGGVTIVVLSTVDVVDIFRGRISGKQLFKNVTNTTTTVAGGTGGWLGGAALGTAILPGAGTIIGGLLGSVAAGATTGKLTSSVLDHFIEDDAQEMLRIIQEVFGNLAKDYLLNQSEAEKAVDKLSAQLKSKTLKEMFASQNKRSFATDIIRPIIEDETKKRKHVYAVSEEQMTSALRELLESIADDMSKNNNLKLA